jgi:PAS domain S-box-containing protein
MTPDLSNTPSHRSRWVTLLGRYTIALASLLPPCTLTLALLKHPQLGPLVSFSFVLAVAASAWYAGFWAGILVSAATGPALVLVVTHGKAFLPPSTDPAALAVMFLISLLASRMAAARKRVEEVLRSANRDLECRVKERTAELNRAREWLQITLKSISDAVIATDGEGRIVFMNGAAQALTGWTQHEAVGRPLGEIFVIVNEETRAPVENPVLKVLRTVGSVGLANHTVLICRDGRETPIDDSGAPIRTESGEMAGVVLVFRDITDRRRAEREREAAEQEVRKLNAELDQRVRDRTIDLEASNKELEAFSYSVAHDLRAPLRGMASFSKILLEDYGAKLPEEGQKFLERIHKNAIQMAELIDCLLAFARLGRQALRKQWVSPGDVVLQAWQDLDTNQDGRHIEITIGDLPPCEADPLLLKHVFVNLLSNALKYTRMRETAKIEVGLTDSTVYYVRDNGVGFDMRYRDKLFGVFQRLHRAQDYEGTGVGLALVQRIIRRHGGHVWADAIVNQGATFYFTLSTGGLADASIASDS